MPSLSSERVKSLLGAVLFAALGFWVVHEAGAFSRRGAMLPLVVGYGMIALSAVLALTAWLRPGPEAEAQGGSITRRWLFVAVLATWVALIPWLGFLLASALGFMVVSLIVPRETPWTPRVVVGHVVAAILATLAVYLVFAVYLGVPLPVGQAW